jgi:hypothetical protein
MANANGIFAKLERKAAISTAAPERHTVIQRVAEALSRRNADAAIVELFSEAVQRLTQLAYERDDDGAWSNIDAVTWRLLIPAPWGRAGHRSWGITSTESVVLREMIFSRQAQEDGRGPGLWLYDRARRAWRLNLFDYDQPADGLRYWQRWPLSVADYREARSRRLAR